MEKKPPRIRLSTRLFDTGEKSDGITTARRPRIILIGDSAGGHIVFALARWIRDESVHPVPDGMLLLSPSCDPCKHRSMASGPGSLTWFEPITQHSLFLKYPRRVALGRKLIPITYSIGHPRATRLTRSHVPGSSPKDAVFTVHFPGERVGTPSVSRKEGTVELVLTKIRLIIAMRASASTLFPRALIAVQWRVIHISTPKGMGLFMNPPRALIVVGDVEQLERVK